MAPALGQRAGAARLAGCPIPRLQGSGALHTLHRYRQRPLEPRVQGCFMPLGLTSLAGRTSVNQCADLPPTHSRPDAVGRERPQDARRRQIALSTATDVGPGHLAGTRAPGLSGKLPILERLHD
jgi:hypothetical protein